MTTIIINDAPHDRAVAIPVDFARNPRLTPRAAKVCLFLASSTDDQDVSIDAIHKAIHMSRSTVGAALHDLEDLGYLEREDLVDQAGRFAGKRYRLSLTPAP